jgi:hypothetical protein
MRTDIGAEYLPGARAVHMTFSDYSEVNPGFFVGAHPRAGDPFELGADVVVCLTSGTSVGSVPRGSVLVHWPIEDGPVPDSGFFEAWPTWSIGRSGSGRSCTYTAGPG